MGDAMVEPASSKLSSQGNGGSPLSAIAEGVADMSLVIDPDVAQKACQDVLEKVKLMHSSSENLDSLGDGDHVPNGDSKAGEPTEAAASITSSRISEEDEVDINCVKNARRKQKNSGKQSWLLRLFECKLFDISMAISYLYNSKEPGVQAYIGNRLFYFKNEDVDFYLPQLLNMYIHMDEDVGDAIKPYVVHRCRHSINFSLQCAWLLGAYSSDMHISTQRHSRGTKLRKLILSDELKPAHKKRELPPLSLTPDTGLSPSKRTHQRSKSDATPPASAAQQQPEEDGEQPQGGERRRARQTGPGAGVHQVSHVYREEACHPAHQGAEDSPAHLRTVPAEPQAAGPRLAAHRRLRPPRGAHPSHAGRRAQLQGQGSIFDLRGGS
ncbi:unnamed protein product [Staurois parvus]|uniref:PIK helical domain-containing protein n=1 Tax=Staurois parvus TaxID=386267 RepID=A0ABN9FEA2_9NEOB|nr:unnamed protein product [Staurois parvus]